MPENTEARGAAAGYCRVSTAMQAQDGLSLADQERQIKAHAQAKGWELAGVYVDAGVSGRKESRPQLDRMRADAEAGKFEFLIVNRFDRLGRNNRNLHNLLHEIEAAGVKFVCLNPDIDTSAAQGRLQLGVLASVAEFESDMAAERVKPIMRSLSENGHHHARPPYGYATENKRLVPDPQQAPIVMRIFEERAAGQTQRAMCGRLNAEGIKTATGRTWDPSNIGKLLKNRVYIGEIESGGNVYPGKHEPLVSRELWGIVATLREAAKAAAGNGRGRLPRQHLFVLGHLRCGLCGNAMVPRTNARNGYGYYQCQTRKESGIDACAQTNIPREPLDTQAWAYFESAGIDIEAMRQRELEAFEAAHAGDLERLKAARKAAAEATANHQRVKDQVKRGGLTAREWRTDWQPELEQEIAATAARVAELEQSVEAKPPSHTGADPVRWQLIKIRLTVEGALDSPDNIAAARAGLRRVFKSFTIAPVEGERPKARRWVVTPKPKFEPLERKSGPALLVEAQTDNKYHPIVADTVQFLDAPRDRSENGARDEDGAGENREPVGVGAADGDDLVF